MPMCEQCPECGKLIVSGETVTILASEYTALKERAANASKADMLLYLAKSRIGRQPDIAKFILDRIRTMTVADVAEGAKAEFGSRAPSRSSIYRFVARLRPDRLL